MDYSDKPTVIVGIDPSDSVVLMGVQFEGFDPPPNLRVIVRDWSAGSEPDENGDIYEDTEV